MTYEDFGVTLEKNISIKKDIGEFIETKRLSINVDFKEKVVIINDDIGGNICIPFQMWNLFAGTMNNQIGGSVTNYIYLYMADNDNISSTGSITIIDTGE